MRTKQVLVMKKFPKDRNMRTGKYIAQGCHASVGALFSIGEITPDGKSFVIPLHNPFINDWVTGSFKKIALYVETDQALLEIYEKAKELGLPAALIRDAGLTEFNGNPTLTAVGIGPENEDLINEVTGHLPLY
jgi:peptidyl-tRNA hydrolase, PTH2 family